MNQEIANALAVALWPLEKRSAALMMNDTVKRAYEVSLVTLILTEAFEQIITAYGEDTYKEVSKQLLAKKKPWRAL